MKKKFFGVLFILFFASCSSLLKYQKSDEFKNKEFENKVVIVETPEAKEAAPIEAAVADASVNTVSGTTTVQQGRPIPNAPVTKKVKVPVKEKKSKVQVKQAKATRPEVPTKRQPETEDSEGFNNQRRPPVDPFKVGETVVHDVSYLGATAGTLTLKVNPYAVVNGKKSYNFVIDLKSTSFFSKVFAVDDKVQTYVDYETLVPHVFKLDIRDSGQVKEAQAYFDNEHFKADYWEHRYTEKNGHEEKKYSWEILPYSQNPFSAIFYMRVFKFVVGREYSFRVADDEKNVTFKAKAIEQGSLKTDAGTYKTIKLKAEIYSRGNLAKATDFYIWVSDDDRKYILRIEVKLPFGSIVSEASKIVEGSP